MKMDQIYPVLLIGFNRAEFISERLKEIISSTSPRTKIYVSIDGPRLLEDDQRAISNVRKILEDISVERELEVTFQEKNLGCDIHIVNAVTKVLKIHNAVIIIEDDVQISKDFYYSLNAQINANIDNPLVGVLSGFSPFSDRIKKLPLGFKNNWRISRYYNAWGTAIKRDCWNHFEVITDMTRIREVLKSSSSWDHLSQRQQRVWVRRFLRGNYDFQMQLNLFRHDLLCIYPKFRMVNNIGFNDERSTHTKGKKPKTFLGSGFASDCSPTSRHIGIDRYSRFWRIIDSNSWSGDGLFSVRAREAGIRTHLKRVIKRITNVVFK